MIAEINEELRVAVGRGEHGLGLISKLDGAARCLPEGAKVRFFGVPKSVKLRMGEGYTERPEAIAFRYQGAEVGDCDEHVAFRFEGDEVPVTLSEIGALEMRVLELPSPATHPVILDQVTDYTDAIPRALGDA